jgi:NAD(P)-dependent dehydrogenase (short-subunit alcohol dehydrogenase family)
MILLENKWALVTGSSRGIGQQIAWGLADHRCNVVVHGRSEENTRKTLEGVLARGVECHSVTGDLSNPEGVADLVRAVNQKVSRLDILYNNAATQCDYKPIWEFSQAEWDATFQVNVWAIMALCNAFAPGMKARGFGRIINLTSGIRDTPNLAPYSVSKAALDKYSMDLAAELKGSNVLVNFLDPGWLLTDMGGPNAMFPVETVLPGALVPALLEDNGPSGRLYRAQDFKYLE